MWGCVIGAGSATGVEAYQILFGRNFHAVIPERVYRCAQQSSAGLEQLVRACGIRTVVNLRGCCATAPWYLEEARTSHRLDLSQEDVCLSAYRLPPVPEIRRLVKILDRAEYPILLHCRRGADRTGLASALVLLLQTKTSLEKARHQLGCRYGHLPVGRPAILDQFFDLYAEWLQQHRWRHSPALWRHWLEHKYCPGPCRCRLEPLEVPTAIHRGDPSALRVRVWNTGNQTWKLSPDTNAGIHAGFIVCDTEDHWLLNGRSGLFSAQVPPGTKIDLTLVVPALKHAGHYRVLVDMVDEQHCWFFQTGSEPLERELVVRE